MNFATCISVGMTGDGEHVVRIRVATYIPDDNSPIVRRVASKATKSTISIFRRRFIIRISLLILNNFCVMDVAWKLVMLTCCICSWSTMWCARSEVVGAFIMPHG